MATYVYTAKKSTAETVNGQINAKNQDEAIDLINQLGLLPVSVEEQGAQRAPEIRRHKPIKSKELYIFSRQLANLLRSGVTLLRALTIIKDQTSHVYFKTVLTHIIMEVQNGRPLSQSLNLYPKIFSNLYVTMVKAGEESGNLEQMLLNIAEYQHSQDEIKSKVRMAMAYPLLMAVVGIATVYFILAFVLPKMSGLFETIGDSLPLPTMILMGLSAFLSRWWFILLPGLIAGIVALNYFRKSPAGKAFFSRTLLSTPLFGEIILKSELSRFCRTLLLLIKSGMSIIKALEISIPILSNDLIKEHLYRCNQRLIAGGSFGEEIRKTKALPDMMGHLISVGEETGSLHDVLQDIAISYEEETKEKIKVMTTLLEPLMILVIGAVIGFMVFAILLPIFQMDVLSQ
ncbi:MAG: type II secretion system F family protein [Candidatus Omnitrophica bacterium]|nr:type II secretion system F family protein [Candidatus Omnitrophota bacterium]